jgi:TrmH family RNA methyltransferase
MKLRSVSILGLLFLDSGQAYKHRHAIFVSITRRPFGYFQGSNFPSDAIIITSTTNKKVKFFKSLIAQKKVRDTSGLVVIEGHRQVLDALAFGLNAEDVLISPRAVNTPLGDKLIFELSQLKSGKVSYVTDSVIESISDTVNSQGVVASFMKPQFDWNEREFGDKGDCNDNFFGALVLDGLQDPGNVGSLIRTAYGLGFDSAILISSCDAWSPKVLRSSMGMSMRLPLLEVDSWSLAFDHIRMMNTTFVVAALPGNEFESKKYHEVDFKRNIALVIGSEARGVNSKLLMEVSGAYTSKTNIEFAHIPINENLESLNAACAGAIFMCEIAKQRNESTKCS